MSARENIEQINNLPAEQLCAIAEEKLEALVDIMNKETMLLRAGHLKEASALTPEKTQFAQDYVMLARAIQREAKRLKNQAPENLNKLQQRHESLATQMAENLRVLATAKNVAQDILSDVAKAVGANSEPKIYNMDAKLNSDKAKMAKGLSINKAL